MPAESASNLHSFDYTILRVVPRVERQEFVNVGVLLFCKSQRFLDAKIDPGLSRIALLAPQTSIELIRDHLALIPQICAGEIAIDCVQEWPQSERFTWLAAPKSTIIQTSPVHRGLCGDPAARLAQLYELFVE